MNRDSQLIWEAYTEASIISSPFGQPSSPLNQISTSQSAKPLYHASMSNKDLSCLHSFRDNGVDINRSQGYGQGAGFYLFIRTLPLINGRSSK